MIELAKELQELREMQVRRRDDLPTVPPHIHKEES
jgi:DNA-binding HxlR family transcriptional regulator